MKLSITIVNYNSARLTHSCLESLLTQKLPAETSIVVVDNASSDESVSFLRSDFPEITVISNEHNLGLARAVNQGFGHSRSDYYLTLNPDIIALPGSITTLINYLEKNPTVGICSGKLMSPNGELQPSCFRWYTPMTVVYRRTWLGRTARGRKVVSDFLMKDFDHASARDVDWLMGSCLMVRGKALAQVGGMDERFFLYFEDVDWCRRFWEQGWRVSYLPTAEFSHFHQQSSRTQTLFGMVFNWTTREHIRSALKYFFKYRGAPGPRIETV